MYLTSTDITSIIYLDIDNYYHGFWVLFIDKVDTDFNLTLTLSLKTGKYYVGLCLMKYLLSCKQLSV